MRVLVFFLSGRSGLGSTSAEEKELIRAEEYPGQDL